MLKSFFVLKLSGRKIVKNKYSVSQTFKQSLINGEIVRLAENQLLDTILEIRGFDLSEYNNLLSKKKKLMLRKTNLKNIEKLSKLIEDINYSLYCNEIINVEFEDERQYMAILKNGGFEYNGLKYVRFLASAGMVRKKTIMFCVDYLKEELTKKLQCGIDFSQYKIVPSKYNAYFSLSSSSGKKVSTPKLAVVKDLEVEKNIELYTMYEQSYGIDPELILEDTIQKINLFDGQGLISPNKAQEWAIELGLDYVPSVFIIRSAWMKGIVITFDFHEYANKYGVDYFTDYYGNKVDIDEVDVIVSESQFKLAGAYKSTFDYLSAIEKYNFSFRVTRTTPKKDKDFSRLTYQYVQAIDWKDVHTLCEPTINHISNLRYDADSILDFVLGEIDIDDIDINWFTKLDDYYSKCLLLEPHLVKNKSFQQHFYRYYKNKIQESFQGILRCDGNYQFVLSDPVAQCQHILGMNVTGELKSKENYSSFWNNKGIDKVSCLRSPMTGKSEKVTLNLVDKSNMYENIYSGIVLNIYDDTLMRLSGAD